MRKLCVIGLVFGLLFGGLSLQAQDGPLTPINNLQVRTDENGYLRISAGTVGLQDGPLTPLANLRGRTDENGYLRVACDDCGGVTWPLTSEGDLTIDTGHQILLDDGTVADPAIAWTGDPDTGIYGAVGNTYFTVGGDQIARIDSAGLQIQNTESLSWESGTSLFSDTVDVLELRRTTNAQAFNVYGTFTDASNYERISLLMESDDGVLRVEDAGTGTAEDLIIDAPTQVRFKFGGLNSVRVSLTQLTMPDNKWLTFEQDSDPAASECNAAAEHGRITINDGTAGTAGVYVCDQAGATTGWTLIHDLSS